MALTTTQREQIVAWAARAAAGRDARAAEIREPREPMEDPTCARLDQSAATLADVLDLFDRPRADAERYGRQLRLIHAVQWQPGASDPVTEYVRRLTRALSEEA